MKLEALPLSSQAAKRSRRWRTPLLILVVLGIAGGGWTVMQAGQKADPRTAEAKAGNKDGKGGKDATVFELAGGDVSTIEAKALALSLPLSGSLAPVPQATIKACAAGSIPSSSRMLFFQSTWPVAPSIACSQPGAPWA